MRSSEVPPAGKPAGDLGAGELVERDALRSERHEFDPGAMRDPKACGDLDAPFRHLDDRLLKVGNPIYEDRLIAFKVFGKQEGG